MALTPEEAVQKAGSFGWYQFRLFCIISYAIAFASMVLMVMTFSTAEPPWRCVANSTTCNITGVFKPGDASYGERCGLDRSSWEFVVEGDFDSIVTEWDLVCEKGVFVSLANSMTFVVWIFGAMIASVLSDRFGRKTVTFPCVFFACLCGLISAFAHEYWMFALFRGLMGAGLGGYSICGFVLVMEYIGTRHRSAVGISIWYPWILALCLLSLLGYLIPSWRTLSIVVSSPGLAFIFCWWFTPESLRWYLVKRKFKEAKEVLVEIGRAKGRQFNEKDFVFIDEEQLTKEEERLGDIRDLFASRTMTHRTLVSWYCWFVSGLVYYGISLSSTTIGGNMYLNFFLSAVFEGIGMALAIPMLNKLGRKKTIVAGMYVAALGAIVAAILSLYDDGSTAFLVGKIISAMVIAKFFITIAFDGVYVYSSELFPTVVRNTAMGSSTSAARVGSFTSPYIVYSQQVHPLMPFGIMAINALICGILCMTLPETNNMPLPDSVKETSSGSHGHRVVINLKEDDHNDLKDDQKPLNPLVLHVSAA